MLEQTFASLATGFAAQFGAPFGDAVARWPGTPTFDAGGSITAGGTAVSLPCKVQFDAPTQAMRAAPDFMERDARIIVLAASLAAPLDTKAKITVGAGLNTGTWELLSCIGDPAGIGYECRGRKL